MITLDALTISLLVGAVLPLLTALVTKAHASPGTKAAANLVLSIATAGLVAITQAGGHLAWQSVVVAGYAAYAASGTSYAHFWQPVGVTGTVASLTAGIGIGGPPPPLPAHAPKASP